MNLLLDTNILIDFYDKREPFYQDAKLLCVAAFFGDVKLWTTTQSLADAEYILCTCHNSQEVRSAMRESLSFLQVCGIEAEDGENGLNSSWPDLEDYYVAQAARRIKAEFLITRDKSGFHESSVPVLSPSEFLSYMADQGLVYEEINL